MGWVSGCCFFLRVELQGLGVDPERCCLARRLQQCRRSIHVIPVRSDLPAVLG